MRVIVKVRSRKSILGRRGVIWLTDDWEPLPATLGHAAFVAMTVPKCELTFS
jgi:hypothetical protein